MQLCYAGSLVCEDSANYVMLPNLQLPLLALLTLYETAIHITFNL